MSSSKILIDPSPAIWKNMLEYFSHNIGMVSIRRSAPLLDSSLPTKTMFIFVQSTFEGSGLNFPQLIAFGTTKIVFGSSVKRAAVCSLVEFDTQMYTGFT